ncbi:hypothetical protein DYB26_009642, partial [Aphanomyces astaci]
HDGMNNQQLNDHDDGRLDLLQAANPTKQNHKELQYLKSLAGNHSDTLRSLALAQWELLVLKMQLVTLHARNVEVHTHDMITPELDLVDMSLIDMNNLPPSQQIPTDHFPLDGTVDTTAPTQPTRKADTPFRLSCWLQVHAIDKEPPLPMALLTSPFKADKRFPNRVTKFRYDKDSHEYSFMHVTKFVYPKSAGPTKSSPFQLKPSVQVSGIRAPQHDGALNDALQDE